MNHFPKPPASLFKLALSLKQKKYRLAERLSTAEGDKLIREVLSAKIPLHSAFFTKDGVKDNHNLVKAIANAGIEIFSLAPSDMAKVSSLKTPPGVLVIFNTGYKPPERKGDITLGLFQISDPGNLGTILRTADWFGVAKVYLSDDSVEIFNPAVVRGSMGAIFRLPVETDIDLSVKVGELQNRGWKVAVAETRGGIIPSPRNGKTLLVLSDELGRLPAEIDKMADIHYTIPRIGRGESLNLASACSVILYAMTINNL
jgi:TrmH family RNA methyltransferase